MHPLIKFNYLYILFYILIPIFVFYIHKIIKIELFNNSLILLILLFLSPQYHLFEKYYDPLVLILALTILKLNLKKDFFSNHKFLFITYLFYISLLSVHFFNYYYINY